VNKYKITRVFSEKENERIAQKGLGAVNLNFDAMRSQSDSDKDTSGVNDAAAKANDPLGGVMGYDYIPGRGSFGKGGDFLGSEGGGQPAEMELDPAMMASMSPKELQKYYFDKLQGFAEQTKENALDEIIPKLQTLHNQYLTSTPTGKENFLQEAKTIIALLGNTLTPQNKNYIIANFPGFARLF
jgi:hypothetical protein